MKPPVCKEFNEFNYLIKIDTDLFIKDLPDFKTFEAFRNTWLYEWNDQVPWVSNKPAYYDELEHSCEPIRFMDGTYEWPSCDWRNEGICNGGSLNDENFCEYDWEKLHDNFGSNWENTYHPIKYDPESNDNEFIDELDDYLNMGHYFKPLDKNEESFKERKYQLLGIPHQKLPTFTAEKYEVVKYSFGPMEEYAAIITTDYKELARTEENVAKLYGNIFRMKEEGWHVTRTK